MGTQGKGDKHGHSMKRRETWVLKESEINKLMAFERKIMRIIQYTVPQGQLMVTG
jgi:hypothetical protein